MTLGTSGPRSIALIRHGEKPPMPVLGKNPDTEPPLGIDELGGPNEHSLTPRGWQRAGALAVFFGPAAGAARHASVRTPTVLLAPDYGSAQESAQHRPLQTLTPLSQRIGVVIATPVAKGSERDLVEQHVLTAQDADVLICWDHQNMGGIVAALNDLVVVSPRLGAGTDWPDDRFDMVLMLTRSAGNAYTFAQIPQLLLDGDSDSPLPSF